MLSRGYRYAREADSLPTSSEYAAATSLPADDLAVSFGLRRILFRVLILLVISAGLYGLVRLKRDDLVDFTVPHRAAVRFLAHEQLYRPSDGHYQYKYLPTFAAVMVPFT